MDRIAVVTGAASGIGARTAAGLAAEGCAVFGLDIAFASGPREACGCPAGRVREIRCDVSRAEDVEAALRAVVDACGAIDYLVNAAGIIAAGRCKPVGALTLDEWDRVMAVNLTGTFLMCRGALPHMRRGGCIVNLSTEQVRRPNVKSAPYAVSKAGIEMLTKILALEHTTRGIRANAVALGSVRTNFIREMVGSDEALEEKMRTADRNMPLGLIETDDVWRLIRYVLLEGTKMTGQTLLMESGMTQN